MHQNSLLIFKQFCLPYLQPGLKLLEVGPCRYPSPFLDLLPLETDYHCCDRNNRRLRRSIPADKASVFVAQPEDYRIDTPSETYDAVLSCHVIAHVYKPWIWIQELARLLKPGGRLIIISSLSHRHGPMPYDGWRVWPDGLKALCDEAGLNVLASGAMSLCEGTPAERRWQLSGINPIDAYVVGAKQ